MNILMVCLGNICRSPLAEGIMQHKINTAALGWQVDSAGTGGWHAGELPHHRSQQVARQNGLDITGQRARQFQHADFDRFDLIFAMDAQNQRDLLSLAHTDAHRSKVQLLLEYAHGTPADVPDPYYDGRFALVYELLDEACTLALEKLMQEQEA